MSAPAAAPCPRHRALLKLRDALAWTLVLSFIIAALPALPRSASLPLPLPEPAAAAGEIVTSPRYVSAALMPNGQVGLLFTNGTSEVRFKRYTSEFSMDPSVQLSTAAPPYPQLATFQGKLVAAYVDTRSPNVGKLIVRTSTDSGASWSAESNPFGSETFSTDVKYVPVLVASRDGQTLYLFTAPENTIPQYRKTTDPNLATWTAAAAAGDASMHLAQKSDCGLAGQECYRAHNFEFLETTTPGQWVYITRSDGGTVKCARGTQVGMLGGSWSPQVDHGGGCGISGQFGESRATTFLDRAGNVVYLRVGDDGDYLYQKKSADGGYSWGPAVHAYDPWTAAYVAGSPVGLYVPAYTKGEYIWFAGWSGPEDTVRVIPLWSAPAAYGETGSTRLFGSGGGDWDNGTGFPWVFGDREVPTGIGSYHTSATDLALPGRLLGLAFRRSYNSADIQSGPLGPGWTHSYNWSLTENPGRTAELAAGAYATASSSVSAGVAGAATDASDATSWKSAAPITGQWLQVDLQRAPAYPANIVRAPLSGSATYSANRQYSNSYQAAYAANGIINNGGGAGISWAVNGWQAGDWWKVTWSQPHVLTRVRLWDRESSSANFGQGRLVFSDGSQVSWSGLPVDAGAAGENFLDVSFARKTGITWLQVISDSGGVGNAGLAEVEAYDDGPVVRSSAQNLMILPTGGAAATFTAISQISADYAPNFAANGLLGNGTAALVAWAKNGWAAGDWWKVTWSAAQSLTRVRLRDRGTTADYFGTSGRLRFSDSSEVSWSGLPTDAGTNGERFLEITFARKTGITWMEVISDAGGAGNTGLAEVQAFDDDSATLAPVGAFRLLQVGAADCHAITAYRVQSSPDASTWTDRHTVTADIGGDTTVVRLTGGDVTARYWRLLADSGSASCGTQVSSFEMHQILDQTGAAAEVRRGDGRRDKFTRNADGTYSPPPGVFDTLAKAADGSFSLTTTSQVRYDFARSGRVSRISEPAGNQIVLSWTGTQLTSITDSVGRVVSFVYAAGDNLARGKTYTKSLPAHATYPDTGGVELTDGILGSGTSHTDPAWQGHLSVGTLDVTVDLGAEYAIGQVRSFYYESTNDSIYKPSSVEVLTSTDNVNFTSRGSTTSSAAVIDSGRRWRYELALSAVSARWVRLHIITAPQGWLHSSEAQVFRAGDEPLSLPAGMDRLASLRDGAGRRVTYRYDSSGRLQTVTDQIGNTQGQDPAQHRWTYGYDGTSHHLATITDPDGRVRVTNTYDSAGRLATQKDGLNNQTTFSYGSGTTTITDPRSHATIQTFDARWRVITVEDVVGGNTYTLQFAYDAAGNLQYTIDRNGKRTDFTYDSRGNVLTVTAPEIDPQTPRYVTTYTYDTRNNVLTVTDAKGFLTTHTYDATKNVRLSTTRQIDGTTSAVTKWEYADSANPGLVTKVITPRGNTAGTPDYTYSTAYTYDSSGNLVQSIDADGAKTTHTYDTLGRRLTTVDPEGYAAGEVPADHTWTTAYDPLDRVTSETNPLSQTVSYGYDGASNRTSVTDRRGNVTTYIYDAAARLWKTQQKPDPAQPPVYETVVGRDANGNVTAVTQANGALTDYAYDALDRLTSMTVHPQAGVNLVTSYTFDGNGNTLTRTTADSVTTTYGYDALNRLLTVSASGLSTITYAYDELSRRTSMSDGTGTTTYGYDRMSRLTSAAQPNGTTTYGYDLDSNRTSLVYPGTGGGTATYAYSPGGRLNTVTDWASRVSTYTYTAAGLAKTVAVPGGMTTTYGYDRAQRLLSLTNMVGATAITTHAYTLDAEGNRTALSEFLSGVTAPGQTEPFGFSYDGLNRLTAVTTTNPESFTLDGGSNITARTGPSATYTIDGENRVTSDGSQTFTWSNADRLTARGSDTFGYDPLDRLTSSTVSGTSRTYAYNGDGLLQTRTQGSATSFLWDAATDPSRLLAHGGDRIVYGLGPLYLIKADGTTRALARDGGRSVRAEVDGTGSVTGAWRYRAYGEISQSWGSGQATPTVLGYAGQLLDPSALYYMRARWYDPAAGRFVSRDPVLGSAVSPTTLNAFNYASSSPMMRTDPSGLCDTACLTAYDSGGGVALYPATYAASEGLAAAIRTLVAGLITALVGAITTPGDPNQQGDDSESQGSLASRIAELDRLATQGGRSDLQVGSLQEAESLAKAWVGENAVPLESIYGGQRSTVGWVNWQTGRLWRFAEQDRTGWHVNVQQLRRSWDGSWSGDTANIHLRF